MELIDRKAINNTGDLDYQNDKPWGSWGSIKTNWTPWSFGTTAAPNYSNLVESFPALSAGGISIANSMKPPTLPGELDTSKIDGILSKVRGKSANRFGAANVAAIGQAAMSAINAYGAFSNSFSYGKSAQNILDSAKKEQNSVGGFGYETYNNIGAGEMQEVLSQNKQNTLSSISAGSSAGSSIGSIFGPVGGAIGGAAGGIVGGIVGLFGGSKRKKEAERQIRLAQMKGDAINQDRFSGAYTKQLLSEWYKNNIDTINQNLFRV